MSVWPRLRTGLCRLARQDDGSGSVLPMLMLTALLFVAGFGIDTANLWRNSEVMRATADAAAHAGAVALARGNAPDDAKALAEEAIALNMDPAIFAPDRLKPRSDLVRLWHYDAGTGALSEDGTPNAVSVQIRRGPTEGNPVPMYLLGLLGLKEVTTSITSVVALTPSSLCDSASGIFARQDLTLEGEVELGGGYCLHSQKGLSLGRPIKLEDGARLSMPDLAACDGFCDDAASPGFAAAAVESNLVSRPLRDHIAMLMTAMLGPTADSPEKTAFFATRPIDDDLEPLAELGLDVSNLRTGSVVRLPALDFEILRAVPRGLVYAVTCDPNSPESPPVLDVGGGVSAAAIDDVVLLTNCALHFPDDNQAMGSLIISSYEGDLPVIAAEPFAMLGDLSVVCDPAAQTQVMVLGDQTLPPGLILSNVALVVDGAVTLLPGEGGALAQHRGFALHASGPVTVEGHHSFESCAQDRIATLPELDVIRFVMPKVPAQPSVPMNDPKLPGKKVAPLPSTPPLPMSKVPPRSSDQLMSQAETLTDEVGL